MIVKIDETAYITINKLLSIYLSEPLVKGYVLIVKYYEGGEIVNFDKHFTEKQDAINAINSVLKQLETDKMHKKIDGDIFYWNSETERLHVVTDDNGDEIVEKLVWVYSDVTPEYKKYKQGLKNK